MALGQWAELRGTHQLQGDDPLSRIRYYFELRFDHVMPLFRAEVKDQWVDRQVTRFLKEVRDELDSLQEAHESLEANCATSARTSADDDSRFHTPEIRASVAAVHKGTKLLREKLIAALLYHGSLREYEPVVGEDLEEAAGILGKLLDQVNHDLRQLLFAKPTSGVLDLESGSPTNPLLMLRRAEVLAEGIRKAIE